MILVGREEWDGPLEWLRDRALADHRVDRAQLAGLRVVAHPEEVVDIVSTANECQRARAQVVRRRATRP